MFKPRFARANAPLVAIILIAAYAFSAFISLKYLRAPDGSPAIYVSNAFLLSGLLLLRGPWRLVCLVGCVVACAALIDLRGATTTYAVGAGLIAGVACVTGAWLGRKVLPQPRLKNLRQAILILALVIVPSSFVSGLLSSTWIYIHTDRPILPLAFRWFFASVTGTSMILPTLLMLATPSPTPAPRRSKAETASLIAAVLAILVAPYFGFYYVALVLALPMANLLAMRIGAKRTACTLTVLNLSAFAYPFLNLSSLINRAPDEIGGAVVLGLQIYSVVVFNNGVLTALAIDQQTRTKRQLERRTAMARAARAEALAASRAKTEFLATMSHEVRTPLNSILGFSQLLDRRADLADDARQQIGMIQRSGESLLTIVDDILDFSKVEAGKLTLDPRPGSLRAITEEALAIVAPAAADKRLSVSMTAEGADGRHLVDDHRLRQILLNFLNNAVKFTHTGQIEVRLSVRPARGDQDVVRIEVHDTGVGITPEALPRLFQQFTQADSSISRSFGGTGLGLSISKALAELMGGKVGAESTEGQGSVFWVQVTLPRAAAAAEAKTAREEETPITARVLLVDDNPANRELGVAILEMLGCTADTAADGNEAIAAVRARRYDLILMDVHMPGTDGLAATRAIRQLPGQAGQAPIIAMTADVLPEQVERCRAAGMVDHVAKPINVEHLYERLVFWLEPQAAA